MGDVGTSITNVPIHLAHDTDVLIAVEQRVLVLTVAAGASVRSLVRLKTGIGQDDDQTLRVLVSGRDGGALLGNQLRQRGGRERLCAYIFQHVNDDSVGIAGRVLGWLLRGRLTPAVRRSGEDMMKEKREGETERKR